MSVPRIVLGLAALSLAGCSKQSTLNDAGPAPDTSTTDSGASIDAGVDASARGTVTVHVLRKDGSGLPAADAVVVFLDPDGTLVAEPRTSDDGVAKADVLPGASVTAINVLDPTDHELDTIFGVEPGDDLVIGSGAGEAPPAGTFSVDIGIPNVDSHYDVYGPCGASSVDGPPGQLIGGTGTLVPLTIYASCRQATMDLIVVRQDGTTTAAELKDVPFVDGGSTAVTATYEPLQTLAATFSNVPATVGYIVMSDAVPDVNGFYQSSSGVAEAGALNLNVDVPLATSGLVTATYDGPGNARQTRYDVVDGSKGTYPVDVGATLLPWLDVPALDPATAKLTVTMTGTGAVDLMSAYVVFWRPDPSGGGSGSSALPNYYRWTLWSPTAGDLTLPTLPADVAANNPAAGDNIDQTTASLYEASAVTRYDQVRAHLYNAFDAYRAGHGTGSLRVSTSPNQVGFAALPARRSRASSAVHAARGRGL